MDGTKTCTKCQEAKPLSEFYRRGNGYYARCKRCLNAPTDAKRERNAKWKRDNPGYTAAYDKRRYAENSAEILARNAQWRANNPDRVRTLARRNSAIRYARKLAATIIPFTEDQRSARWAYYGNKCWLCGVDATEDDHIKPLAKGGAHMLCNIRPACRSCNSSKNDTWPLEAVA